MLEWAAEQTTEISTEFIDREFQPIMTNQERGVPNLEFILQQMHTMLTDLTSVEANDIVANSRKNPLEAWRRLQKRCDPTAGGRKRNLLRTIVSPERCSLLELQEEVRHVAVREDVVEQDERRDQAGWPGSVGTGGAGETLDSQLQCCRVRVLGVFFKCGGAHLQRDCNARKNAGKQASGKGNQGKSWSKSEGRGKGEGKTVENFKWESNGTEGAIQVSKGSGNDETSKKGISDLENLRAETSSENQESVQMGQVCVAETSLIHKER